MNEENNRNQCLQEILVNVPATFDSAFFLHLDLISSMSRENFYVMDVITNRICYVPINNFFLCGHSVEKAMIEDDFYKRIVYPDDLLLWEKMRKALLLFLKDSDEEQDEVDYFSCTLRLQYKVSFSLHPLPHMVYHRMKPVWIDCDLRYLICFVGSSAIKKSGNLHIYYKDGLTYKEYNPKTQRWKRKIKESLTEREKAILMLAQQGKSVKEIANDLHRGYHTIRNQINALFKKLEVSSMQEVIDFAFNHRIIYASKEVMLKRENPPLETHRKRYRVLLTTDMLKRIQKHLDDGKSNRQAAKLEGIAESAVRYWIGKGALCSCSSALNNRKVR